jgi:hypothetical protein
MPADLDPPFPSVPPAPDSAAPAVGMTDGAALVVDDRLDTVLRTRAAGPAGMRVQFRQLADLLGRVAPGTWTTRHGEALARLDDLFQAIGAAPVAMKAPPPCLPVRR